MVNATGWVKSARIFIKDKADLDSVTDKILPDLSRVLLTSGSIT